jgi:hypothetical protein
MAGRTGFVGMTSRALRNRFFRFGHSDYFQENGKPSDVFMREQWVPLLLGSLDDAVEPIDERRISWRSGIEAFVLNNAQPIKVIAYGTVISFISLWGVPTAASTYAVRRISSDQGYVATENSDITVWFQSSARPARSMPWLTSIGPITRLDLERTYLTDGEFYAVGNLSMLRVLKLGETEITGRTLPGLARFPRIEELSVAGTNLRTLKGFPPLHSLKALDLTDTHISDADLDDLPDLPTLEHLDISQITIRKSGLRHLARFSQLKTLTIADAGLDDEALRALPAFPRLETLTLTGNSIRGSALGDLIRMPALNGLWIKGTALDAAGLLQIARLKGLRELSIPETPIEPDSLSVLGTLQDLREIYLGGTAIIDRDLELFFKLPKIHTIYIPGNRQLSEAAITRLTQVRSLKVLNIDDTRVSAAGRTEMRRQRPDLVFESLQ